MNKKTIESIVILFAISANKQNCTDSESLIIRFQNFLKSVIEDQYVDEISQKFAKAIDEYSSFSEKKLSLNSVRLIKICAQTAKNLSTNERISVVFYLLKLLNENKQSKDFVQTVADVYEIPEAYKTICDYFENDNSLAKKIEIETEIVGFALKINNDFIAIKSESDRISINNHKIECKEVEIIDKNSVVTIDCDKKFYFNDICNLGEKKTDSKFKLIANKIEVIRDKKILLHELSCEFESGELIGVIGKSGSGKTTFLKTIAGADQSFSGIIYKYENGIASDYTRAYLAQQNTFIPLFSVNEHLKHRAEFLQKAITEDYTNKLLDEVDLYERKDNIVAKSDGNAWQLSGGQQKRLGIAMEMLADPEVLILDEPNSGLSSYDSSKIIHLLKNIARKNKIVIASIHQPDYETFMEFDKILIIDEGGYAIFYGTPTFAAEYFRKETGKIDKETLIETHFNPAIIFNIIDEKNHDENGNRVISPEEWYQKVKTDKEYQDIKIKKNHIHLNSIKSFIEELKFSISCDLKNKIRSSLIFLIPPIIGIIFSMLTRFSYSDNYEYFSNPNIPAWTLILLITSFFLGLVIAGHEYIFLRQFHANEHLIADKRLSLAFAKIVKYIFQSIIIAILISLPATIIIGNTYLLAHIFITTWILTFCGNALALLLSLFARNVSTIYLLIPLIIIPQMIFSGGLIQFDNFNPKFVVKEVPVFSRMMPIRWASEAIITDMYQQNPIEKAVFAERIQLYNTNNVEGKRFIQHKIDEKLANISNCDSISKERSNIYISKIVLASKDKVPPIYNVQGKNENQFLSGHKEFNGKIFRTYEYNLTVLLIINILLTSFVITVAKIKKD